MQISIYNSTRTKFIDATPYLRGVPQFTKGEHGMERCDVALDLGRDDAIKLLMIKGTPNLFVHAGDLAWRGRVEDVTVDNEGAVLVGYGLWSILDDEQDYTELWSTTDYSRWESLTEEQIATVTDAYRAETNDRLYIAPRKGSTVADGERGGLFLPIPDGSTRNIVGIQFEYEIVGGGYWQVLLRRWAASSFTTPTTIWNPSLSTHGTYTGAVCATFTGSPLLTFELVSLENETTLGTTLPAIDTTLAPSSPQVNTTYKASAIANTTYGSNIATGSQVVTPASMSAIAVNEKLWIKGTGAGEVVTVTAVTGPTFTATYSLAHTAPIAIQTAVSGSRIVTPTSMTNIVVGTKLLFNTASILAEKVSVSAVTGTTFTASFKNTHIITGGEAIRAADDWAVPEIDTTMASAHAAGAATITPGSMANIAAGISLVVGWGSEAEETVTVSSVTGTTFNCTLAYGHVLGSKIRNTATSCTVRPNSMTGIATGLNLDIGGRNREVVTVTATTATTFTAVFLYGHPGDAPVTLAKEQTVTPASMTDIRAGKDYQIGNESGVSGSDVERIKIRSITGSTFTAEFDNPHGPSDGVRRIYQGEWDVWLKLTNVRVVTSIANMISTTISSTINAGVRTVTPVSMTGIYAGQMLVIEGGFGTSEMVEVTSITPTTFTATFAKTHSSTVTVKALAVYGDEIVSDVVTRVAGHNDQLSASTVLIESPGLDLTEASFEDQSAMDVCLWVTEQGDGAGRTWSLGVWDDTLHFHPRGSGGKTYYLDATRMRLTRSLESTVSSVQVAYSDKNRRIKRTVASASVDATDAWAVNRNIVVDVLTTNATIAAQVRDTMLAELSAFVPSADIEFDEIHTAQGARVEKPLIRPGDSYVVIRNLPAPLPSRRFRIMKAAYSGTGLRIELEGAPNSTESLVAKSLKPLSVMGPREPFVVGPIRR